MRPATLGTERVVAVDLNHGGRTPKTQAGCTKLHQWQDFWDQRGIFFYRELPAQPWRCVTARNSHTLIVIMIKESCKAECPPNLWMAPLSTHQFHSKSIPSFLHSWPLTPSGNSERRRGGLDCSTWDRDLRGAEKLRSRFFGLHIDRGVRRRSPTARDLRWGKAKVAGTSSHLLQGLFGRSWRRPNECPIRTKEKSNYAWSWPKSLNLNRSLSI